MPLRGAGSICNFCAREIARIPGRHESGTGSQPIGAFLDEVDRLGYEGFVGLGYRPLADTETSLEWMTGEASRPR
jgi:hydroxypyruvate isomerase